MLCCYIHISHDKYCDSLLCELMNTFFVMTHVHKEDTAVPLARNTPPRDRPASPIVATHAWMLDRQKRLLLMGVCAIKAE